MQAEAHDGKMPPVPEYDHGAIVRGTGKKICLVFTGHEFADGYRVIRKVLQKHRIQGSFFLTGDFYRNPRLRHVVAGLKKDNHYLGGHSDRHLLYCDWSDRDSLLVSKTEFIRDLKENYAAMEKAGISADKAPFFLPPYEWYNDSIAAWCTQYGLHLVNFTPGTGSNQDWTWPAGDSRYIDSETIYRQILAFEEDQPKGLDGFILLTHLGTDPRRKDKFYNRLDSLLTELERRGYTMVSLGEITGNPIPVNH
jgi:peptidoglycan/xylan/chitin deacetylase (PgdA/CDA1 family)